MSVSAQKPKADFDVNIKYDCNSAKPVYVNKSVGAVKYFWKIDGWGFRECYVPAENYYFEGKSFTATLIAVSSNELRDTITKNVVINSFSKAVIRYNKPDSVYYAPATIQFFNESYLRQGADSLTYTWNFGYGIDLKEKNPVYTFKTPGTYNVSLTGNLAKCAISAYATVIIKDTAQRDEFPFIKSGCYQDGTNLLPVPNNFGQKYEILNDTLRIRGIWGGNCGSKKTATIRYKGDTIVVKTWEVGPFTTCNCVYYFEINIPHYKKDSAMILFNGERVKSIIDAVPQVNRIDQSIHIYPNPVSDNFLLETDDNSIFPVTAIIKDVNGRKVTENSVNTSKTSVNTSDLKPGIYVLYLYSMQGFATKKIIKI
jgi:PKD repeat protein